MAFQEGFNPFGGINKSSGSGGDSGGGSGAGGGVMIVTSEVDGTLSANFNQLKEAVDNNMLVVYYNHDDNPDYYSVEASYLTHLNGFVDDEEYNALFTGIFDDGNSGTLTPYYFVSSSPTGDMLFSARGGEG